MNRKKIPRWLQAYYNSYISTKNIVNTNKYTAVKSKQTVAQIIIVLKNILIPDRLFQKSIIHYC